MFLLDVIGEPEPSGQYGEPQNSMMQLHQGETVGCHTKNCMVFFPPLAQEKLAKILYTVMHSFQLHMLSSLIQTSFNTNMPPVMNYSSAMNFICFVTRKSGKQTVGHYFNLKISREEDNPLGLTTSDYV